MKYDLIVIGAGPAGYEAGVLAARAGLKTAVIEKAQAGGTCLNRGCIPTKALLESVHAYKAALNAEALGVICTGATLDYAAASHRRDRIVSTLSAGVRALLKNSGCDYISGEAFLDSAHSLTVNGTEKYEFDKLIIATGSAPAPYPFDVGEGACVLDSDGFLALSALPQNVLIVGGGVIGMEFATILSGAGSNVLVAEAMPRVLPGMDAELGDFALSALARSGVRFAVSTFVTSAQYMDSKTVCTFKHGDDTYSESFDAVVVSVGRRPNTVGLNIAAAGIATDKRGYITVDDYCRTNIPGIYAAGDVNGQIMLAHAASAQAECAVNDILGKKFSGVFLTVPSCVYTSPELAAVGITEEEANKRGIEVKIGRFEGAQNGRLMTMNSADGFVKIVADAKNGAILGAAIACEHASDIIGEVAAAIKLECTARELAGVVHAHPTVYEMIGEACRDVYGESPNKPARKKR